MLKQFKYAVRFGLYERLFILALTVALNFVLSLVRNINDGWLATALTFSSLNLCAVFIVCVIWDVKMIRNVYSPFTLLTPVKRWKVLLPRIVVMMVYDLVTLLVALTGLFWQSVGESAFQPTDMSAAEVLIAIGYFAILATGYFFIMSFILMTVAVDKSLFQRVKLGFIPRFFVIVGAFYVSTLADFILAIFMPLERKSIFFSVTIYVGYNGFSWQLIIMYLLYLMKAAAFFTVAAKLTERRVNI